MNNSVVPYVNATLPEIAESLGITQFPDASSWFQVIGGLIVQGGRVTVPANSSLVINFLAPHEKQVLGIFTQGIDTTTASNENSGCVETISLDKYTLYNGGIAKDFYWWSVGV